MRRPALLALPLLALAACTTGTPKQPEETTPQTSAKAAPTSPKPAVAPPEPQPASDGTCPYLSNAEAQEANGQKVGKAKLSADKPHPTCFFYRSDGKLQARVWIYVGDQPTAKALIDQIAPVAGPTPSSPEDLPGGWIGGSLKNKEGVVYAVYKDGFGIAVTSNQDRVLAAKRLAEKALERLKP